MPRRELFDRAVKNALTYAQRLGAFDGESDRVVLHSVLELWYLKTRFAYRIPLDDVVDVLLRYPGPGYYWRGGPEGEWIVGEEPAP
jgi:hypothetical protein